MPTWEELDYSAICFISSENARVPLFPLLSVHLYFFPLHLAQKQSKQFCVDVPVQTSEGKQEGSLAETLGCFRGLRLDGCFSCV